jgi:small multidrug resistance family-3 protein
MACVPAGLSLMLFAWLLTLHPTAAGRVYAAYGGAYIAVALIWLWRVDGVPPTRWDVTGAAVALGGMGIIVGVDGRGNALLWQRFAESSTDSVAL